MVGGGGCTGLARDEEEEEKRGVDGAESEICMAAMAAVGGLRAAATLSGVVRVDRGGVVEMRWDGEARVEHPTANSKQRTQKHVYLFRPW